MAFTTIARIRALGGFRAKRVIGDSIGVGNGVNITFTPHQFSVFVSPTADDPQLSEITVYVNGTSVGVASISESAFVLSVAPPNGSVITADYWGHNLPGSEVEIARTEAESEVFGKLIGMYEYADLASSPLVSRITAYLAAAILSDQAYNEMAANTPNTVFPPDRLRRVANGLMEEILTGVITLVDETGVEIPIVAEIDSWIAESTYGGADRLFENDQFYSNEDGTLLRATDLTEFRWL